MYNSVALKKTGGTDPNHFAVDLGLVDCDAQKRLFINDVSKESEVEGVTSARNVSNRQWKTLATTLP